MTDITMPSIQTLNGCTTTKFNGNPPIRSLSVLSNELTRVLHNRQDPQRLCKAKVREDSAK